MSNRIFCPDHPLENATPEEFARTETAYRRGFAQGVAKTLAAVRRRLTPSELGDWEWAVTEWRHYSPNTQAIDPPRAKKRQG